MQNHPPWVVLHLYSHYGIVFSDELPNIRHPLWSTIPMVTFTPLARNWYRVNGAGKSLKIKKDKIDSTRRYYENGNRKPLPRLVPIESLKVRRVSYLPSHIMCPNCYEWDWATTYGRKLCTHCNRPFNLTKE